jgi:hypothetical protein
MAIQNVEQFILDTILKVTIGGVFVILISNIILFPEDRLTIYILISLFVANATAYIVRKKYPNLGVVIVTTVAMSAMGYQRYVLTSTSTTLAVMMIVGFMFSFLLKGRLMLVMHFIAVIILNTVFLMHQEDPATAAITYSIMYFILTYSTWVLKSNYDRIYRNLDLTNKELLEKGKEIEAQNEELMQAQDNLNDLNKDLERKVNERTAKIQNQNQILIQYGFTNAHHLRGPVSRLLGLAMVYKIEENPDHDFYMNKMVEQAYEIDAVVKEINNVLESNDFEGGQL